MKYKISFKAIFISLVFMMHAINIFAQNQESIRVSLEKRASSPYEAGAFIAASEIQQWNSHETAIIVVDMWDQHWCKDATNRVTELAPAINNVISAGRQKGMLIIHAPSDCMDFYKGTPGRKLAQKYHDAGIRNLKGEQRLDPEKEAVWPIDQANGGCNDTPACKQGRAWKKEHELIEIKDHDAISDSGVEIAGLLKAKGIKNVVLLGVHTNMCIINRPFGLRNLVRLGMNVVLMRDLTDTMYDAKQNPVVSHFTGNSLMVEYIEKYICPTMLSCDFTGQKQFRFKEDKRPVVAFVIAENEYHANQTLPEFAHQLLLKSGVNCEFALGKPVYTGEGIHNIENLQIMQSASLAVIQVRRRALPSVQMDFIKEYVKSGKPIIGLRTASHAFNANQVVPNSGGAVSAATGKVSAFLDQYPEFDQEVLGGNYQGHYGLMKVPIVFSVVPGMEKHPLFEGVLTENFSGPIVELYTLYENRPLRSANIQVLLQGAVPDKPVEPVFWINHRQNGKVIYTSMGHWEDWKTERFNKLMSNSVQYLLNK